MSIDLLPIDAYLPRIVDALTLGRNVVIEAPPGTGKTTRVPLALWRAGLAAHGDIVVLQPRRLATRLAANYCAEQLHEPVGRTCGYQVRFDARVGPDTAIRFVTEGVLTRQLRSDTSLTGTAVVVFDEFHERHLDTDIALAVLRRLQRGARPDLAIVAMSATLDAEPLVAFLDATRISIDTRTFPIEIDYVPADDRELPRRVLRALADLPLRDVDGHVLVFLPGTKEIRATETACRAIAEASGFVVAPLYGELDADAQDQAVRGSAARRLILATNVAETSITIDGVAVVIDSGLCRQASHDPWSGLPRLELSKISRAAATQRAGRAGRTQAGRCVRLYSRGDHDQRPTQTEPEIARLDLSGAVLDVLAAGTSDVATFTWFEPPKPAALSAAIDLLRDLGAVDNGRLTNIGRDMLRFAVSPRIARFLVAAETTSDSVHAARVAAVLSEGRPPLRDATAHTDADADVLETVARLWPGRRTRTDASAGGGQTNAQIRRTADQLARQLGSSAASSSRQRDARDDAIRRALLVAFPDRVATVRDDGHDRRTLVFARGGSAELSPASVMRSATWAIALAVQEVRGERGRSRTSVWSACAIDPQWLLEDFLDEIDESIAVTFDPSRERIVAGSELRYGNACIEATEVEPAPADASELLLRHALARGAETFARDPDALTSLQRRLAFAHEHDQRVPVLDDDAITSVLAKMCTHETSFAALRRADLLAHVELELGPDTLAMLDRLAPPRVRLAGGRQLTVHYERDRPPWVQSRLQDFFGSKVGPAILGGNLPLVVHLLAPNQRAVQVTTDLAGFWERHYPELRKQLSRRYPKHAWPDDPVSAEPPAPHGRRR